MDRVTNMNLREYKYILEIYRCGNITSAAKALGISQPSLSRFLQTVEQRNRVALFERKRRQLILTPAGEQYTKHARRILELSDEMREISCENS